MTKILKEKMNQIIVLLIVIIAFGVTLAVMLKYKTEGETNLPIVLDKIMIVSSAEAESKEDNPDNQKWNLQINQYNDVYMNIDINEEYKKTEYIKSVSIENINIEQPQKGKYEIYMPNSSEGKQFVYNDMYLVQNSLTYNGSTQDNARTLEIANQGGVFLFRVVNRNIAEYVSNEDDEIKYDGTLLGKTGINEEELKARINFDIVLRTNETAYRGNVTITIPNENLSKEGVVQTTDNDFSDVVFKRERIKT